MKNIASLILPLALLWMACPVSASADDQRGAERTKKPVGAQIIPTGKGEKFGDEWIGNVEVTYADGSKYRWTTRGNCGQAHVSADGTVGWTIYEAERKPPTVAYTVRTNDQLVLCRAGKTIAHVHSGKAFIEEWHFLEGGKELVLRTRALHGVALIERHESATGRLLEGVEAFKTNLPAWAAPLADR